MPTSMRFITRVTIIFIGFILMLSPTSAQEDASEHRIYVWEATSAEPVITIETGLRIWNAELSADGTQVIAALQGGLLRVYDATSGELSHERQLADFDPEAEGVPYFVTLPASEANQLLVIGDGRYGLWDWSADEMLFEGENTRLLYSSISPDGTHMFLDEVGTAVVIALPSGDRLFTMEDQSSFAEWSADSQWLAVPFRQSFRIYDGTSGVTILEAGLPNTGYMSLEWSPTSDHLAAAINFTPDFETAGLYLYTEDGGLFNSVLNYTFDAPYQDIAWNLTGTQLAVATEEAGGLYVFDALEGELVRRLAENDSGVLSSYWNADSSVLSAAVISDDQPVLRMWDMQTGQALTPAGSVSRLRGLAHAPNHDMLAVYGESGDGVQIDLYDLSQPETAPTLLSVPEAIRGLRWSVDSTHLLALKR